MEIDALRDAIKNRRIEWQRHSLERMLERDISRSGVLEVVMNGEIIEDYPDAQPFPSALFLGWIGQAYEPQLKHFKPGFKVRKKR